MPLVSVVVPSYNHEKFVSKTIESILGQNFDDLELIVVDDASRDASRRVIQKYAMEDARVRVILHETNCGIAKTINDGIAAAQGKFLAYSASDDVWIKDKLSKQLAVLKSNEGLIVWTGSELIDESGRVLSTETCGGRSATGDGFHDVFSFCRTFTYSTLLHKKANMDDILWDERLKYANDFKFYLDLAARYAFHYIAEPLAQYRVHANNTWGMTGPKSEAGWRLGHQENAIALEHALSQYHHRMSAEVKAKALEMLCYNYYKCGQNRKALMCFCKAFAYDPVRRSYLQYPRFFFRFTQNVLGRRFPERR